MNLAKALIETARHPAMRDCEFTARQLAVLAIVSTRGDGLSVRDIAAVLEIPKPSVSRALDSLCNSGLVERQSHTDRRMINVVRLREGKKVWRILEEAAASDADPEALAA
jgi:DNA-binding MarR family transcriptional regulator